ncbi:hypothetical protein B0H13DRAFT_1879480 [Mycena leptocephala]|nr:hypothetical protein B0H13DRAFT_1879480 [Mycena leptocephala]
MSPDVLIVAISRKLTCPNSFDNFLTVSSLSNDLNAKYAQFKTVERLIEYLKLVQDRIRLDKIMHVDYRTAASVCAKRHTSFLNDELHEKHHPLVPIDTVGLAMASGIRVGCLIMPSLGNIVAEDHLARLRAFKQLRHLELVYQVLREKMLETVVKLNTAISGINDVSSTATPRLPLNHHVVSVILNMFRLGFVPKPFFIELLANDVGKSILGVFGTCNMALGAGIIAPIVFPALLAISKTLEPPSAPPFSPPTFAYTVTLVAMQFTVFLLAKGLTSLPTTHVNWPYLNYVFQGFPLIFLPLALFSRGTNTKGQTQAPPTMSASVFTVYKYLYAPVWWISAVRGLNAYFRAGQDFTLPSYFMTLDSAGWVSRSAEGLLLRLLVAGPASMMAVYYEAKEGLVVQRAERETNRKYAGIWLTRMGTELTMPAAVFQAAGQSPQGLEGSFDADLFVNWSNTVYGKHPG